MLNSTFFTSIRKVLIILERNFYSVIGTYFHSPTYVCLDLLFVYLFIITIDGVRLIFQIIRNTIHGIDFKCYWSTLKIEVDVDSFELELDSLKGFSMIMFHHLDFKFGSREIAYGFSNLRISYVLQSFNLG